MRRIVASLALGAVLLSPAPSLAFFPVIDVTSIAAITQQITQTIAVLQQAQAMVAQGQQNLQALRNVGSLTNIPGRIAQVTGLLQQAQTACNNAQFGHVMPQVCKVEANAADAQAAQLGRDMAQVQGLQATASGVNGSLAAQQTTAAGIVEVATQLQEIHQLQLATATKNAISDAATLKALNGAPTVRNPGAP